MMNTPRGCEFPTIQTFEKAPSAAEFESGVELTNFPAVTFFFSFHLSFSLNPIDSLVLDFVFSSSSGFPRMC